jgi:hypothetical protein
MGDRLSFGEFLLGYKNLFTFLVFVLLCFGMIELSYRFYASGPTAFNPVRFNSLNILLRSGLVERVENPEIFYQLKPDINAYLQAEEFRTNSSSMADREYTLNKPDKTFRIAVIGSSWTMGTGLQQEDTYHSLLETKLNELNDSWNYEFLNFGVEYYGLREIVATAKHRALKWNPDVMVIAITPFTTQIRWIEPTGVEELPAQTYPFFQSYALRAFDRIAGLNLYERGVKSRQLIGYTAADGRESLAQLYRALKEIKQLSNDSGVPAIVMWLSYQAPVDQISQLLEQAREELGIHIVETHQTLKVNQDELQKLHLGRFDTHPNRLGSEWIAETLRKALLENELLPDNQPQTNKQGL